MQRESSATPEFRCLEQRQRAPHGTERNRDVGRTLADADQRGCGVDHVLDLLAEHGDAIE
jgi:hypothetical protein